MLSLEGKTILAIAPHVDDVELGSGATAFRLAKRNDVYYVALSMPPDVDKNSFMEEFRTSTRVLGIDPAKIVLRAFDPRDLFSARKEILQLFFDMGRDLRPDVVLVPSSSDIHQSHEVVFAEARRAFKHTTLLGYELPWNNMNFATDVFVRLTEEEIQAKVAAIAAFESQKHRRFFANNIILDLARVRGKQVMCDYAECFEAVRIMA